MLRERVSDWFELDCDSPYMLLVADVARGCRVEMTPEQQALFGIEKLNVPRSDIPAVTHVDYSARIQTVHRETNPRYHALVCAFERHTGCPVIVNTSFNVRGEPIVCTPEDAFRCFMGTEIETLAVGDCLQARRVAVATFSIQLRSGQSADEQLRAAASRLYYEPFMTPQGIIDADRRYNEIVREVAAATGALLVDGEDDIPGDPAHFADTVHFTDAGSAAMAARVTRALARDPAVRKLATA